MASLENILSVVNASPTSCLILYPDAPRYTVVEVNETFIREVGVSRCDIIGKGLFEAFIDNRDDTASESGNVVKTSLEHAALLKKAHKVRKQRYDVALESGGFEVRYWDWDTYPILDENNNVQFILHNPVDITEQVKQVESERQKYQSLFNSSPLPMWVYDFESLRFLDINEAAINHYGYSEEEFLSMTIKDIRPKSEISILENILAKNVKEGAFNKSSVKHLKKNGEEIFVHIEGNSMMSGGKKARIVVATDVTEKLKTERALIASEQRFKALVQNGSDLINILDTEGNFQYISPACEKVFGIHGEYLTGKNIYDFIHEDDKGRVISQFLQLNPAQSIKICPFRFKDTKNRFRWIETIVTDMTNDPAVGGIVTNSRDVTQDIHNDIKIREGIERFKIVSKATSDVIYDWNFPSNKIKWSKGLQTIFGHKKIVSLADWWYDLIHPDDAERIKTRIELHMNNRKTRWQDEYRFRCTDGTYKVVLDRGVLIYKGKTPVRMIGCMQDITERVNHIQAIEEQNKRFHQISWIQSHLVRAPLSRIMGITALMCHGDMDEQLIKELLPHLDESAKELDEIIRDIVKKAERFQQ